MSSEPRAKRPKLEATVMSEDMETELMVQVRMQPQHAASKHYVVEYISSFLLFIFAAREITSQAQRKEEAVH